MRLLLYTVAVPVLATCSAARADSYAALAPMVAHQEPEAGALAQDDAAVRFGRSDPLPTRTPTSTYTFNATQDNPLQYRRAASFTTVLSSRDGSPLLGVYLPTLSLEDYAGSSICALTSNCSADVEASRDSGEVETDSLGAAVLAIAPEPPSMLLIATGLFGLAGLVRRRTQTKRKSN